MKKVTRFLIIFALLLGALAAYSVGHKTGMLLFIILGFILEGAFWFGIFPIKKAK